MKKDPTFKDNNKRRVLCAACGRFITESRLGEKNIRNIRCKQCGSVSIVNPPIKGQKDGQRVILYGPGNATFTADLTDSEIEDSL